jgi:prepilin-type processing-associated H-X9-DG protein
MYLGLFAGSRSNYVGCFSPDGIFVQRGARLYGYYGTASYTTNPTWNPTDRRALFAVNSFPRRTASVSDGLSNTVAMSEVISGPDGSSDNRGVWFHPWMGTMFTGRHGPNTSTPDHLWSGSADYCVTRKESPCQANAPDWSTHEVYARSRHSGGVNCLLADGSVRFVSNSIAIPTWQAALSIDGGEVLGTDW